MKLFEIQYIYFILRIIIAGLCGILIGSERKFRLKGAGIRTHCLVACAAALMMIVSKYAFFDVISEGMYNGVEVRLDPSRIASTIASGIGFLGAGTIFVHKNTVSGLTTAAGIWATSGVGMAIGSGMYVIGIAATFIIVTSQILLHMNFRHLPDFKSKKLIVYNVDSKKYQSQLAEKFKQYNIRIQETKVKKDKSGKRNYTFSLEIPVPVDEDDILSVIEYECEIASRQ